MICSIITATWIVATSNCYWAEPPSCVVRRAAEEALCKKRPKEICWLTACMSSRLYCDTLKATSHEPTGESCGPVTVSYEIETSTKAWNRDMDAAMRAKKGEGKP